MGLIEKYLDSSDEISMRNFLEANQEAITPEFLDLLANIAVQVQSGEDKEIAKHIMVANRVAMRFSMERNLSNA